MAASSAMWAGVRYAFGRGLDPRNKDGVRAHPWVFAWGVLLHLGIAAATIALFLRLLDRTPGTTAAGALLLVQTTGGIAGLLLIGRRLRDPVLQAISVADDYLSASLTLIFIVTAAASLLSPAAVTPFFLSTAALVLYAPFGKIRHCVLFFVTRARLGAFLSARGVLVRRSQG